MGKVNEKLGTDYKLFNYYGAPDAEPRNRCNGLYLRRCGRSHRLPHRQGEKVGLVKVRLFRPWEQTVLEAIPATCKKIAVLDRTKEPGAQGEPLYLDVVTSVANAGRDFRSSAAATVSAQRTLLPLPSLLFTTSLRRTR